jgi:hypothetical protein
VTPEPADLSSPTDVKILNRALDTIATVPAALAELGGKIDASREASGSAHAAHAAKLDGFSTVVAAATAAQVAATDVNKRLATVLEHMDARTEANAAKVTAAAADVEVARKQAEETRLKSRAELWKQVDGWIIRLGGLLTAAWFAHQELTTAANTTTTTATTTIAAPAAAPTPASADGTP